MDESNLRGLRTRKALRDFTLMPSICRTANNEENKLKLLLLEPLYHWATLYTSPYHNNGKVEDVPGVPEI